MEYGSPARATAEEPKVESRRVQGAAHRVAVAPAHDAGVLAVNCGCVGTTAGNCRGAASDASEPDRVQLPNAGKRRVPKGLPRFFESKIALKRGQFSLTLTLATAEGTVLVPAAPRRTER
jgi:hypothetical protein